MRSVLGDDGYMNACSLREKAEVLGLLPVPGGKGWIDEDGKWWATIEAAESSWLSRKRE